MGFIDFRRTTLYDYNNDLEGMGTVMPLMDEFKEEREQIKNRSLKEKLSYFWDYYKWHVLGTAIGICVVVSLIHTFLTQKETAYYSAFVNMAETWDSEEYKMNFATAAGVNLKKEAIYFDANMRIDFNAMDQATLSTTQKLLVFISGKELDSLLGDRAVMNRYAYNEVLVDLREFLTAEEMAKYEPYFFYMDRALVGTEDESGVDSDIRYPEDPTDPSTMTDPVPVAILLHDCKKFSEVYLYGTEQYVGFLINSPHPELNHFFLNYIMEN